MARICEICSRVEEVKDPKHKYDILDVCPECTQHVVQPTSELED